MKLEVGMYVRTNLGEIAKLIEYRHFENETGNYNYLVTGKEIKKAIYDDQKNEHIIKASHNIIDLIEVGDVIEWRFKYDDDDKESYKSEVEQSFEKEITFLEDRFELRDIHIIKVLTHEVFEREAYKDE